MIAMHLIDVSIFILYMLIMLGVGVYFMRRNKDKDDYFVGGRNMGSWHVGLSVVATDVGGGFSIGLGGLGFLMGLSGSWMLFTGLLGAWLAAVFLIPAVKKNKHFASFYTFPQIFGSLYSPTVALVAAVISFIGYIGFTSSQLLAGAKLAAGTLDGLSLEYALLIMGAISIIYTVLGGIKAVIYTDTIQWIILMGGFIFIGIPVAYYYVGGWDVIVRTLPDFYFRLDHISWKKLLNWSVTILPIWFVGMTLYQRIFACRDVKTARKAWFIAGLFEYPVMAFMGVALGLLARVAFANGLIQFNGAEDAEMGLPLLLHHALPVGLLGLMMSAYFSAILSTADSCLMAASGNMITDLLGKFTRNYTDKKILQLSQAATLLIGIVALVIASYMSSVLDLMLYSYAFMVSGLFVPLMAGLFFHQKNAVAAVCSMIAGGSFTALFSFLKIDIVPGIDANLFGILLSALVFTAITFLFKTPENLTSR